MRKLGIRMDGLEQPIEDLIKNHSNLQTSEVYTVIEIGSAGCTTLKAIYDIIKENRQKSFTVFGFDLPNGGGLDLRELIVNFNGKPNIIRKEDMERGQKVDYNEFYLFLLESPLEFIKKINIEVDLCHIDACHCYKHFTQDFLTIEDKIRKGGYLFIHDIGIIEQGTDLQHDNEYINVRKAVQDLELFNNKRDGWKFVKEIPGSRVTGTGFKDGNSMGVFE